MLQEGAARGGGAEESNQIAGEREASPEKRGWEIANEQLLHISFGQVSADPIFTGQAVTQDTALAYLVLVDNSVLPINSYAVERGQAVFTTAWSTAKLSVPTDKIQMVHFTSDRAAAFELQNKLAADNLVGDVLVIQKKQSQLLDQLTGVLGDVTSEKINFNWDGEQIPVKLSKVAALAYYHAHPSQSKDLACVLTAVDGARLQANQVQLVGDLLMLSTCSGLRLEIPLPLLKEADYSAGKLVYLSDLKPIRQVWSPMIGLPASAELIMQHGLPRLDQSFLGSSLSLLWPESGTDESYGFQQAEKKTYTKGLALRSRTELQYRIPASMRRFICIAGIDPATVSEGHVTLMVYSGKQLVWQGDISGRAAPVGIEADLASSKVLRIVVDYGDNLDYGDRVHLVEARVSQ